MPHPHKLTQTCELDSIEREEQLISLLKRKPALSAWYLERYFTYKNVLERTPSGGVILELGSGAGFAKEVIPDLLTSDFLPYKNVDRVIDATTLPFTDESLRAVFLLNVLHHTPDAETFFGELERCLKPQGRVLIIDQYPGIPARWIYRYLHHEPFHPEAQEWRFESSGPLSDANGALAWIVFERDRSVFEKKFRRLKIESIRTHSPLRYWLTGGLRPWCLLPKVAFPTASFLDSLLISVWHGFGSFVDVELCRAT